MNITEYLLTAAVAINCFRAGVYWKDEYRYESNRKMFWTWLVLQFVAGVFVLIAALSITLISGAMKWLVSTTQIWFYWNYYVTRKIPKDPQKYLEKLNEWSRWEFKGTETLARKHGKHIVKWFNKKHQKPNAPPA